MKPAPARGPGRAPAARRARTRPGRRVRFAASGSLSLGMTLLMPMPMPSSALAQPPHPLPADRAPPGELTTLLDGDGDERLDRAFGLVYRELKMIAHRALARAGGGTLGTTGLVHEAYAKLAVHESLSLRGRRHFFALCARAMRQIVIDHARRRRADKRGAGQVALSLADHDGFDASQPDSMVALDAALSALEARDPRLVELLQLRMFAGMELVQIAPLFGVTVRQLQRDWQRARLWLYQALLPDAGGID